MKKVVTFGVFDYFHYGHLMFLEQAKALGDHLIVAVQDDAAVTEYKPDAKLLYTAEQRVHLLQSLRIVDEVVIYRDVDRDIKGMNFDIFAIGEDQEHEGFRRAVKWCEENGRSVVRLCRTGNISSKGIKESVEMLL